MTRVVTITNQKGGVAKTTTVHALASKLSEKLYGVLVIDLDPQCNLTYAVGIDNSKYTIYELFNEEASTRDTILHKLDGDIIPGSLSLAGADMEFTKPGREYILKEIIEPLKENYDYILIDTPPALGILTVNALTASTDVIIPMGADIFSIQGLSQLKDTIDSVKKYCNKELNIAGLLLTRFNSRTILSKDITQDIQGIADAIGTKVFKSTIRESVVAKEAQALRMNIYDSNPKAPVTGDYINFVEEFLKELHIDE